MTEIWKYQETMNFFLYAEGAFFTITRQGGRAEGRWPLDGGILGPPFSLFADGVAIIGIAIYLD